MTKRYEIRLANEPFFCCNRATFTLQYRHYCHAIKPLLHSDRGTFRA